MADPTFPATIETLRLTLHAYGEHDAEALVKLVDADRTALRRDFHATVDRLTTIDAAKEFIRESAGQRAARQVFIYGIWDRRGPALIGQFKVKNIAWEVPSAELSYFVGSAFRRQGYATEAVSAVLHEAFGRLSFNRIYARVIPSNSESVRLSRKLGMVYEGRRRNEFRCGYGELHDVECFSLTGNEYTRMHSRPSHSP